jgi:tetratricopeptide (TPR) repeat protein
MRQMCDDGTLAMQMGLFHAADGKQDHACEWLSKACALRGEDPRVHYSLGLASAACGDVAGSARYFQRAWELSPTDLGIAYRLALAAKACTQQGIRFAIRIPEQNVFSQGSSQFSQLAKFVTSEPEFIDAFLALPPSDADRELFGMLQGVVRMALTEHPNFADLHLHASRIAWRLGDSQNAAKHADEALKINPGYVGALLHSAGLFAQQGRPQRALELLERAVSLGAKWPDVHCLAGELAAACGNSEQGQKHLQAALKLKANYPRAKASLSALAA